jgi:hypothetical protein
VFTGLAGIHKAFLNAGGLGILVGDGMLPHPATEQIIETYYSYALTASTRLTADYQFINNPAYNTDRGQRTFFRGGFTGSFRDVRFGSKADIEARLPNVCFTPKSRHRRAALPCPLCTKSRHSERSKNWPASADSMPHEPREEYGRPCGQESADSHDADYRPDGEVRAGDEMAPRPYRIKR